MITLGQNSGMILNGIVGVLVLLLCIQGYRKGLLRSILSLVSTIASYYLAWIVSNSLASYFPIIKLETITSYVDDTLIQMTSLSDTIHTLINRIIWFVIMFFVLKILCFILDRILKQLHDIPVIHGISGLLGMMFGLVESLIWIIVIAIVLETPVFNGGKEVVENSIVSPIQEVSVNLFSSFAGPLTLSDTISNLEENITSFTDEQLQQLQNYLEINEDSNEY